MSARVRFPTTDEIVAATLRDRMVVFGPDLVAALNGPGRSPSQPQTSEVVEPEGRQLGTEPAQEQGRTDPGVGDDAEPGDVDR